MYGVSAVCCFYVKGILQSVVWNGSLSLSWLCLFSVSLFLPAGRVDRQMKLAIPVIRW
jgi:hypothetical protein